MFSSSGYFRGLTCPYFASGLCERPHCHFRHVKTDDGLLRTRVSMPDSVLRQSVISPSEPPPGHRGLPVTVSMPQQTRKLSLLSMVGDAIKQVQKDIDIDRAHLGYGSAAQSASTNVSYHPTPISRGVPKPAGRTQVHGDRPPDYLPTAKSTPKPTYNPTPISVLKKGSKNSQKWPEPYDPSQNKRKRHHTGTGERVTLGSCDAKLKAVHTESVSQRKKHKSEDANKGLDFIEATFSDEDTDDASHSKKQTVRDVKTEKLSPLAEERMETDISKISKGNNIIPKKEKHSNRESSNSESKGPIAEIKQEDFVVLSSGGLDDSVILVDSDCDSNKKSNEAQIKIKENGKDSEKENKSRTHSKSKVHKSEKDKEHRSGHSRHHGKHHSSSDKHRSSSTSSEKHSSGHRHHHKSSTHKSSTHKSSTHKSHRHTSTSSHKHSSSSSSKSDREKSHKHSHSSKHPASEHADRDSASRSKGSSKSKGSLKAKLSHADLFGDSDGEVKMTKATKKSDDEIDSDDVISLSSSTLDEAEFIHEARESLDEKEMLVPAHRAVVNTDDDNFDDFLDYFDDEGPEVKIEQQLDDIEINGEDSESFGFKKKRVAHNPEQKSLMENAHKVHKPTPTPSQIMLERYRALQKEADTCGEQARGDRNCVSSEQPPSQSSTAGKPRTAHVPQEAAPQRGLGLLKKKPGSFHKAKASAAANAEKESTPCASTSGKRLAHTPTQAVLTRPTVKPEPGSKIPINIRQRYLNQFIDECVKIYPTEQDAHERAVEEESQVFSRSSSKKIYLNLSINTIRKIRSEGVQKNGGSSAPKNPKAVSHEAMLGGAKAATTSFTLSRCGSMNKTSEEIKGSELYSLFSKYILSNGQLVENGFPVWDDESPNKVSLQIPDRAKGKRKDAMTKICSRCGTLFPVSPKGVYIKDESCVYHWGKAFKRRIAGALESRHLCCEADSGSKGCQIAKQHVYEHNKYDNLTGYVATQPKSDSSPDNTAVYALDCEMVYTTGGQELTRVTVVDADRNVALEQIVKPENKIIDFNTRFSGMKEEDMVGVGITISDIQDMLLDMFSDKTILVGQSLESDLIALKLIHKTVVDTSVVFPHRLGPPFKRALRQLSAEYLQRIIQDGVGGHDSAEDAMAALDLVIYKVKQDAKKKYRRS